MRRLAWLVVLGSVLGCALGCGSFGPDVSKCADCPNGCCLNGICQPGTQFAACGKGGAGCNSCQSHQVCRTDQVCGVDPNGVWKVQPVSATIAADNNGLAWDPDNSPADPKIDLYCPATAGSVTSTTPFVQDNASPGWSAGGCSLKAIELLDAGFAFQMWDDDVFADDSITPRISVTVTEGDFLQGKVSPPANGGMQSLTIELQKQ